ncbi:MAG: AraC family transcriptional regulator [Spirochaetales bacterium]|nr:AraC family transcriptional regulator [Spirochaetales bacterium]
MAGIFLCHGIIVLDKGLYYSGISKTIPVLQHLDLLSFYIMAPILYFYVREYSITGFTLKKKHMLFFLPAVIFLIIMMLFLNGTRYPIILSEQVNSPIRLPVIFLYCIPAFMTLFALLFGLRKQIFSSSAAFPLKIFLQFSPLRIILLLFAETVLVLIFRIIAFFRYSDLLYTVIMLGLNQIIICFYLINNRWPELHDNTKSIIKHTMKKKHTPEVFGLSSMHTDAKTKTYIREIGHLLEQEKVYRDCELDLTKFSIMLNAPPHYVSDILNREMHTSFSVLINSYRINEAKYLLRENREMNIIEIAYHAGFNSKTTFNTLFKRESGKTPKEYRTASGKD